jgi:hypothetical protein
MRPELLDVVAVYNNPMRWASRLATFRAFCAHMHDCGVRLTVVECAYGERPFELAGTTPHYVGVRARTVLWIKENLINLGIQRLPADWKYVAWIDGDLVFRDANWAAETVHALQQYQIVQPWSEAVDLGPNGEIMQTHKSFCYQLAAGEPVISDRSRFWQFDGGPYAYPHPGYAWAATRQAIEWTGGLIEHAAMGAGDHHMAMALVGRVDASVPCALSDMPPGYARPLQLWQDRALRHIHGAIGYVRGTIEHRWHGRKADRGYVSRWAMIMENRFDPDFDVKRNSCGVLELAGNKPALTRQLDGYFRQRNEDANTL